MLAGMGSVAAVAVGEALAAGFGTYFVDGIQHSTAVPNTAVGPVVVVGLGAAVEQAVIHAPAGAGGPFDPVVQTAVGVPGAHVAAEEAEQGMVDCIAAAADMHESMLCMAVSRFAQMDSADVR